jgi:hypothetical protein
MKNAEVVVQVQGGYRVPQPTGCSSDIYNLMLTCWEEEPTDRPTFAGLVLALTNLHAVPGQSTGTATPAPAVHSAAADEGMVPTPPPRRASSQPSEHVTPARDASYGVANRDLVANVDDGSVAEYHFPTINPSQLQAEPTEVGSNIKGMTMYHLASRPAVRTIDPAVALLSESATDLAPNQMLQLGNAVIRAGGAGQRSSREQSMSSALLDHDALDDDAATN